MRRVSISVSFGALALVLACGPRLPGAQDGGTTSVGSSDTESPTETATADADASSTDADTSSTGEDDDSADEQDDFVPPTDLPHGIGCSVFEQDCDEGDKCVPTTNPDFSPSRCVPVLGDKTVDEPCTFDGGRAGTDDCDATSHCWPIDWEDGPPYAGTCRPLCEGTRGEPVCPGQGETCGGYQCFVLGQVGIPLCQPICDPVEQDCADDLGCYFFQSGSNFGCSVVAAEAQVGEGCTSYNDCAPGLFCAAGEYVPGCEAEGCCTVHCEIGDDAACAAAIPGTTCADVYHYPPADHCPTYGVCVLPDP